MGVWFDTISGHGSAELDSGTPQFPYGYEIQGLTAVTPRVRQLSTDEPLEWQYAGAIGVAEVSGAELIVKFFTQIRFSHESKLITPEPPYATHAFWKLPPGLSLTYSVYW